ncbi:MAG: glycosyltransferase family 2 protein, partial [Acidimicrobiia bacterium]
RQYFQYGRWKREVIRRHQGSWRWRQLASPGLVAGLALSTVAAVAGSRLAYVVPGAYLAATVGASIWDFTRKGEAVALMEPVALWTMHLAWGWGFIVGPPDRRP